MNATTAGIEVERRGGTLVLTPQRNLGELEYQEIEKEQEVALLLLEDDSSIRNVVFDFSRTDYFGSAALGMLLRLWRALRGRGGRMALCNLSAHEVEILAAVRLAGPWSVHASLEAALDAMNG